MALRLTILCGSFTVFPCDLAIRTCLATAASSRCLRCELVNFSLSVLTVIPWLQGAESNRRSLGYEPNEIPLLYPALDGHASFSALRDVRI